MRESFHWVISPAQMSPSVSPSRTYVIMRPSENVVKIRHKKGKGIGDQGGADVAEPRHVVADHHRLGEQWKLDQVPEVHFIGAVVGQEVLWGLPLKETDKGEKRNKKKTITIENVGVGIVAYGGAALIVGQSPCHDGGLVLDAAM